MAGAVSDSKGSRRLINSLGKTISSSEQMVMIPIIRQARERRQWREGRKGSEKSLFHSLTVRRGYLALVVALPVDQMVQDLLVRQLVVSERMTVR